MNPSNDFLTKLAADLSRLYATDPQIQDVRPFESVSEEIQEPDLALGQIIKKLMIGYSDRPALGSRVTELSDAGTHFIETSAQYETVTYGEVWSRTTSIASAWNSDPVTYVGPGDFVCILGFTGVDFTLLDLACIYVGAVSVPLQPSATVTQLCAILNEVAPRTLAVSHAHLDVAIECILSGASLSTLVVFDCDGVNPEDQRTSLESARRRVASAGVHVESLSKIIARGSSMSPAPLFEPNIGQDPLVNLVYTSGSTGTPKGAMYSARLVARLWSNPPQVPAISLNYLPLSHVAGRITLAGTLSRGGTAYFSSSTDLSTLFEDLKLVRPTELFFVPRVCDMIFQKYESMVGGRSDDDLDFEEFKKHIRETIRRDILGGRFVFASCGSALLSAEMKQFMESVLDLSLHDGYGSTEAGGGLIIGNRVRRPPVVDYKLVDVPELGYFQTDKPHPRGELFLKSPTTITGYFNHPEATAAIFDDEGFYKTGDIMSEIGPDHLVFVDRRNAVQKLSQGEFVTISHLESIFSGSPLIRQIFIYGSSERAYLLAVIVPTEKALSNGNGKIKKLLRESLRDIARTESLRAFEVPREFLVEKDPFSASNGLLSDLGKPLRPRMKERYGTRLEKIYADIVKREANELLALRAIGPDAPVLATLTRAVDAVFGPFENDIDADRPFAELGGDSLAMLSFSRLIGDIFDAEIPVGLIMGPSNTPRKLAREIDSRRSAREPELSFNSIHGRGETEYFARNLTIDRFIDHESVMAPKSLDLISGDPRTVFLTGGNGYVGRFLCMEWLERLNPIGGKLICLVRGDNPTAARKRLERAIGNGDAELSDRFRVLSEQGLEVLPGDVSQPYFGLDSDTWNRIAEDTDHIVHAAAFVNHLLPYDQLFSPNVIGTAEVIRLAISTRLKPITFLSTVAVAINADESGIDENADIRTACPVRTSGHSYANGYAISKWASEALLRDAHDRFGLPVSVFRSDMVLAHSRYSGQLNVADLFTRLVLSLISTGIAPRSFYELDDSGNLQHAHYDGLPADFTARAITLLGSAALKGFHTFNVVNPHHDGISLDTIVDWLIESGCDIRRIADYDDWFLRFGTALQSLPGRQRANSVLPVLRAYQNPGNPILGSALSSDQFRASVERNGMDIPHLSKFLMQKYIDDLRKLDLV